MRGVCVCVVCADTCVCGVCAHMYVCICVYVCGPCVCVCVCACVCVCVRNPSPCRGSGSALLGCQLQQICHRLSKKKKEKGEKEKCIILRHASHRSVLIATPNGPFVLLQRKIKTNFLFKKEEWWGYGRHNCTLRSWRMIGY